MINLNKTYASPRSFVFSTSGPHRVPTWVVLVIVLASYALFTPAPFPEPGLVKTTTSAPAAGLTSEATEPSLPLVGAVSETSSVAPAYPLPEALRDKPEMVALRTTNSATFDMGDGTYALLQDIQPMHYRDEAGQWQRINPGFVADKNGWINRTNLLRTGLSRHNSQAKLSAAEAGLGWQPQRLVLVNANGQTTTLARPLPEAQATPGRRSAAGRTVRYNGSWSDPTLQDQWASHFGGAEYSMRLDSRPETDLTWPVDHLELRVKLRLRPGTTLQVGDRPVRPADLPLETQGVLSFVGPKSETLWLQPPQAYEQDDPSVRIPGSYELAATGEPAVVELRLRLPWPWLAARERRFPVIIDPLFQMKQGTTVLAPVYNPDLNTFVAYRGPGVGQFSDGQQRLLVKFDMPTQPPGTTVSKAYLIATPTDENLIGPNYLSQNVLAYRLDNDKWLTDSNAQHMSTAELLGAQRMSYSQGNKDKPGSATWDVTALVQEWLSLIQLKPNYGFMLRTENEFCDIDPDGCGGFAFHQNRVWTDDDLETIEADSIESMPAFPPSNKGGVRLMVFYQGPTLPEGQVIGPNHPPAANFGLPTSGQSYFKADHEYRLGPLPNHWQALVVRGLGTPSGPNPPTKQNPGPYLQPLQGSLPMRLLDGTDQELRETTTPASGKVGVFVLDGQASPGSLARLRLPGREGLTAVTYDVRLVGQQPNTLSTLNSTPANPSVSVSYEFKTGTPLALWNIQMKPDTNSRVDVIIKKDNIQGTGEPYTNQYAPQFRLALLQGNGPNAFRPKAVAGSPIEPRASGSGNQWRLTSDDITPDPGNYYGLALTYNGPEVSVFAYEDCNQEICNEKVLELTFTVEVRMTSCPAGSFPTSKGTCQKLTCPNANDLNDPTKYREAGGLGLWSESGWTAPSSSSSATSVSPGDIPLIGAPGQAPTVAVTDEGTVSYDTTTGSVTLSPNSRVKLVNCGSLANPTQGITDENYFDVFTGAMQRQVVSGAPTLAPTKASDSLDSGLYKAWLEVDRSSSLSSAKLNIDPGPGIAQGAATLQRTMRGEDAGLYTMSVATTWSLNVAGWPSLTSNATKSGPVTPPTVASLILDLGDHFSLDTEPAGLEKTAVRTFNAVRASAATITQQPQLGGASKPVQAVILPVGWPVHPDAIKACPEDRSCVDLRALDDAPNAQPPKRNWQMPDVHTNAKAGTVMLSTKGQLQVFSVDHPASLQSAASVSQEFSFDTFAGTVSVEEEECGGQVVTVVRGQTQITLPNIGDGSSPDNAIAASFKLCQTSLRSVHFDFHSPVGIPLGNSGLFVIGMDGSVDIFPDYTQIKFKMDFQAAQGGDGGIFKGNGEVTIDTRGLFAYQGQGKILGTVDADGKLWVGWSPLDIGFEMEVAYQGWLSGTARAHMWEGQGWQHKYTWLPDNNDRHLAAQIEATLSIKEGQAFSWWFIDIPPDDIDFKVEVAFGQFCTNSSCTSFEWGVKGKFSIVGYDVGVYYGFSHGFDFILGNDGHVLIDQYGGSVGPLQSDPNQVSVRAATLAVNGVATETLTVTPNAENFLVAIGWQAGAPQLNLFDPDGAQVTTGNPAYTAAVSQTTNSTLIGVKLNQPKPGQWKAVVSNLTGFEHYKFIYFANKGAPGTEAIPGEFTAPVNQNEEGTGSYTVAWKVPPDTPDKATISLYYSRLNKPLPPPPEQADILDIGVPIVKNLPFKVSSYTWDTSGLVSGVYTIWAVVSDGVNDFPTGQISDPDDTCNAPSSEFPSARAFSPERFPGIRTFFSTGTVRINDTVAPAAPTGVTLQGIDGAILARWNPSPEKDIAAYLVRWGLVTFGPPPDSEPIWLNDQQERVTATLNPTLRLGGLENNTTYAVAVSGIDASGNISPISNLEFATPSESGGLQIPLTPLNFTVGTITSNSASFSWQPAAGPPASSYRLVYRQLGDEANVGSIDTGDTTATIAGLQTGATYEVSLSAANSQGWRSAGTEPLKIQVTNSVDADSDGMPDDWEAAYGVSDPTADPDGDGLPNNAEFSWGSDPTGQDSDSDGFSDLEERAAGTDWLIGNNYPAEFTYPRLELERDRLVFRAKKGDPDPTAQLIGYRNAGGGFLALAATTDEAWLKATVTQPTNVVEVGLDSSGLEPGYYTGVVRLTPEPGSGPLIGQPHCIHVEAWVSPEDRDIGDSTAITLTSFKAIAGETDVRLLWETASEIDNEGFNLWRSEAAGGEYVKINSDLIPAQGNLDSGASYEYIDTNVIKGVTYYYKLEDVDNHGASTFHGPVSATPSLIHQIYLPLIGKS